MLCHTNKDGHFQDFGSSLCLTREGTSREERKVTIVRHLVHFVIQGIGQVSPAGQGLLAEELSSECLTEN